MYAIRQFASGYYYAGNGKWTAYEPLAILWNYYADAMEALTNMVKSGEVEVTDKVVRMS